METRRQPAGRLRPPGRCGTSTGNSKVFTPRRSRITHGWKTGTPGSVPRLRIDQVMWFNWFFLVPVSIANVVVIAILVKIMQLLRKRGAKVEFHDPFCPTIRDDGETRLVHATDWNRLDISDPMTGRLLTARGVTVGPGRERPAERVTRSQSSNGVSSELIKQIWSGRIWAL